MSSEWVRQKEGKEEWEMTFAVAFENGLAVLEREQFAAEDGEAAVQIIWTRFNGGTFPSGTDQAVITDADGEFVGFVG